MKRVPNKKTFSLVLLLLALTLVLPIAARDQHERRQMTGIPLSSGRYGYQNAPFSSPVSYDEQMGFTFTQDFSRLAFNVTAVSRINPDGVGPAYLLNGLTDVGYWYQVGVSYRWPSTDGSALPGFNMNYEVFDPYGNSIFPPVGGGIASLQVNPGDIILLTLSFSKGNVVMQARDWSTTSKASETYSAFGASLFIGLDHVASNGFFTGLMTEEYHSSPYFESGTPVFYSENQQSFSSAWMWIDEWDTNTGLSIFRDNTTSAVQLKDSPAVYFSSNGTAEVAYSHGFATGLTPADFPVVNAGLAIGLRGHDANVTVDVHAANGATVRFVNMKITARFSSFNASSTVPFTFSSSTGQYVVTIALPSELNVGNYTLVIEVASWQYLEPQAQQWVQLQSTGFNETLTVTNALAKPSPGPTTPGPGSGPSSPSPGNGPATPRPGNGPSITGQQPTRTLLSQIEGFRYLIFPMALGYIASMAALVIVLVRLRTNRPSRNVTQNSTVCPACGISAVQGLAFCPSCGQTIDTTTHPDPLIDSPA